MALTVFALPAEAAISATATTDLNIRSGPGPQYPAVGLAGRGSAVLVDGCIEGSRWCQVDVNGTRGWAYSTYLAADEGGTTVVIENERAALAIPTVTYEGPAVETTASMPMGGELIGPVEAVDAIQPPDTVRTYIDGNPSDPVYLDGEVVLGATVPETVTFREIPDYEYRYVRVNGQPVLVEPQTRRIVYVYR
ncbi:DUF1236 domain-containing protein [Rhizobium sp. RU20A]|uniref:DUF1236 domain-containing protein n=1 Tax=Rhizobium sp. RU20A TaxID=1907412 RepID=UPI001FCEC0B5|nr:DUF1236 domain-containing protein [Rhizobium sp. RU20A]